ncbi:MAG: 23S rRNA (adenine(2030)-N(6))-methyltransferase RlmJ [Lysobacterales bacterium]|nr:23S rRNA (adenine(2030)-N(6))-methyltransferase RlmJ [Xanthomonadales bacterium]MCP5475054.1 23S rRNA (adenine(2030)-N(6))-methyltransferase RlmJ [Rhodanobacteraceae bacterium]
MNYRHAFHAGNFADVLKHAVLVGLIEALKHKNTPFCVIDTHAGRARYSLSSEEAEKTREFASGITPLLGLSQLPSLLHVYLNLVRSFNAGHATALHTYPGSPLIAASLMREHDRLIACELQPDEARHLKQEFARDARVACHHRDGYEALRALLPPKEKRGLVLVDPPYEAQLGEFDFIIEGLKDAHRRWPGGTYAIWYPIKLRQDIEIFYRRLATLPFENILLAEFCLHQPNSALRLNGCGMALINPPYRFDHTLAEVLPALARALEQSRYGSHELRWLKKS